MDLGKWRAPAATIKGGFISGIKDTIDCFSLKQRKSKSTFAEADVFLKNNKIKKIYSAGKQADRGQEATKLSYQAAYLLE